MIDNNLYTQKLFFNNIYYIITTSKEENKAKIECSFLDSNSNKEIIYSRSYKLDKLRKINKFFKLTKNIESALLEINKLIKSESIEIYNENKDIIDLEFILEQYNEKEYIVLTLPIKNNNEINLEKIDKMQLELNKVNDSLINEKSKNYDLISKNEKLKENINDNLNEFQNKLTKFQKEKKNLENSNKTLRHEYKKLQNLFFCSENEIETMQQKLKNLSNENSSLKYSIKLTQSNLTKKYTTSLLSSSLISSSIIKSKKEEDMITKQINKYNVNISYNLVYKGTRDSDKAFIFHEKCNKIQLSLVLILTDKNKRFGGFTTRRWDGNCIDKIDSFAFIFSLDKMSIYPNIDNQPAIGAYPDKGPVFMGCQIKVNDNYFTEMSSTGCKNRNFLTNRNFILTDGDQFFRIKELEVWEIKLE